MEITPVPPSLPHALANADPPVWAIVFWTAVLAAGAAVYFLPAIVAFRRGHLNRNAILMLNLLLGWTVLGWAAAMVWSVTVSRTGTFDRDLG